MNVEEALLVVEKAIWAKAERHLNDAEVTIFRGSWEGLTYDEMAKKSRYEATYLKGDAGHKLWKLLSEALGEQVRKSNFRAAVERARSRFLLETGSGGRSQFGEVLEAKQSSSESGDAGEESQSQTLPSSRSENTEVEWSLVLSGTVKEVDKARAEAIVAHLRKILGDIEVTLERIEEGSVIVVCKSCLEGRDRIKNLDESGQLTEELRDKFGVNLLYVRYEKAPVNLRKWFDDILETGWLTIEELIEVLEIQEYPALAYRDEELAYVTTLNDVHKLIELLEIGQDKLTRWHVIDRLGRIAQGNQDAIAALTKLLNTERDSDLRREAAVTLNKIDPKNASAGVRCGKVIDLGMQLGEIQVALVITLMPELDHKTNVYLRVYPLKGEKTLPPNLQMIVLDDKGEIVISTESRSVDNAIQVDFTGDREDNFIVKIALKNASIMEYFVL